MAPLTDGQVIALVVLTCISSSLSIAGSSIIVYLVLMTKKSSVYNRLMLGMSMFDILNAICLFVHPFLLPAEGGQISAHGNDQTCTMMGFFTQLGTSVPLYNISLNAFFLATVVYGVSELKFRKYLEPSLHVMSILFPLVTASIGAGLSLYSAKGLGLICWIGDYPKGCGEDPSVPCLDPIFVFIFGGIPLGASIIFLLVSNGMIYWKVCSTRRKSEQYRHTKFSSTTNVAVGIASNSAHEEHGTRVTNSSSISSFSIAGSRGEQQSDSEIGSSIGFAQRSWEFLKMLQPCHKKSNASDAAALRSSSREHQQARAVAIQATLYVLACLISLMGLIVMGVRQRAPVQREQQSDIFWLAVLVAITFPLQGFLNVLIYLRPRYLRRRRLNPSRSRLWALMQCLTYKNPPAEARTTPRQEPQVLGCNEPVFLASDSLVDLQTDPAVCARDNVEDAI
ncbi:hypothetical protein MHU86_21074 [Fragilaria crotonensis]|nr:hypothetical protein MHU86_21074 [Fragilaria crotonensis]